MDDLTLRYFDAEMRYLREAGKAFAQAHPDRAAMLDLDKAGTPDPCVERLFEGFAFSMGRLRQKIDDDLPELTESLVSMLWPHYLRTIPSLSVVALTPRLSVMKMAETVPAGLEVTSRPVGPGNTVCRYRTTRAIPLNPLAVEKVVMTTEPDGRSVLKIGFACSELADWSQVDLHRLSLYLAAEAPVSSTLHLMMTKRLAALYLRLPGNDERIRIDGWFSPGGFAEEDRLWPKGDSAFSGYQLLLEYFTFREKFMFVHLNGLENVSLPAGISGFDLEVVLSQPWPADLPVTDDALCLHCVPVINLFTLEADPLIINGLESEYLLRPKRLQDGYTEIYSVDAVTGSGRTGSAEYVPFTSFRHRGGMLRHDAPERYYHTRVKRGVTGMYDTWLILGGQRWEADRMPERETLSLRITGTNGQLPRRALQSTLLDRCEQVLQTPVSVRNLCKPTLQEMVDNWQKGVRSRALPEEAMTGWNEGMTRLQQLAERLNRLDEQRGKYMTVSELKTEVFGIMQAFNRHIPPEERLRRYGEVRDQNGSEQQQKQMENALAELMSRYWILERGFLNGEYKLISESGNN